MGLVTDIHQNIRKTFGSYDRLSEITKVFDAVGHMPMCELGLADTIKGGMDGVNDDRLFYLFKERSVGRLCGLVGGVGCGVTVRLI